MPKMPRTGKRMKTYRRKMRIKSANYRIFPIRKVTMRMDRKTIPVKSKSRKKSSLRRMRRLRRRT